MRPPDSVRDLRRGQIIAAARAIVAEEGLEALTIAALEERLAFTRGVITYHFDGKDEIVEAVLTSAVDEIDRAMGAELAASATAAEKVRAVLRGQVHGFLGHPEAARILLSFWGRIPSDRRAARVNARLYARYRKASAQLVAAAQDPDVVAALLVATVLGIVCQVYFERGSIDPDAAIDEAARMFEARLSGVT